MVNNDGMVKRVCVACICIIICAMLLCALSACVKRPANTGMYYAKSAVVTTIDTQRGLVGFTDVHGDEWYWYCDTATAPWALDDEVLLVMYNAGTAYSYDDVMVSITTEGIICKTVTQ